jgi:hypothetical protein
MTSPTQLSLKDLRKRGYICAIVEHFNPWAKIRQDLFGFVDIVAIHPWHAGVLGVQTTTGANMAARITKAKGIPALRTWLLALNRLQVHGWTKKKAVLKDGSLSKRPVWAVRVKEITLEDLVEMEG